MAHPQPSLSRGTNADIGIYKVPLSPIWMTNDDVRTTKSSNNTKTKIQNRKISFRRVSIWQVQENTSRPYRRALDSKAQGHRGSCTHAKSNSMCNGGIAQGEQYGGGQTAEQPQSNAPMHHCTTARSTQYDAFCTFPENGSVKTWTLSASMSLYGGECLDHATNSKVPDSHGAEIRWIELWRFNIRQQKAV